MCIFFFPDGLSLCFITEVQNKWVILFFSFFFFSFFPLFFSFDQICVCTLDVGINRQSVMACHSAGDSVIM